jgi:hypothetical protein
MDNCRHWRRDRFRVWLWFRFEVLWISKPPCSNWLPAFLGQPRFLSIAAVVVNLWFCTENVRCFLFSTLFRCRQNANILNCNECRSDKRRTRTWKPTVQFSGPCSRHCFWTCEFDYWFYIQHTCTQWCLLPLSNKYMLIKKYFVHLTSCVEIEWNRWSHCERCSSRQVADTTNTNSPATICSFFH